MNRYSSPSAPCKLCLVFVLSLLFPLRMLAAPPPPTSTTLTVTPDHPVVVGTAFTLTATVTSQGKPVSPGLVLFCNADAQFCEDFNILGQAQLTQDGTASLNLILPAGSHDVRAEFLATTSFAFSTTALQNLSVLGTFPSMTTFSVAPYVDSYDLTGTVTGYGPVAQSGSVLFADATNPNAPLANGTLGMPSLAFTPAANATVPGSLISAAVADVNGDGNLDQLAFDIPAKSVVVLFGNGDGTFTTGPATTLVATPDKIAVGDFNNDGIPDFAVTNFRTKVAGNVQVFLGKGDGTFAATTAIPIGINTHYISVGDFNNDGNLDIAVSSDSGLSILLGNGQGGFAPALAPLAVKISSPIRVADLNGDGKADLFFISNNGYYQTLILIYLGNGDGTFVAGTSPTANCGSTCTDVIAADFNGDGKPDLAVADVGYNDYYQGGVIILPGNGDLTFGTPVNIGFGFVTALVLGDFNGDGIVDIAANNSYFEVNIFLGKGDGTFTNYGKIGRFTKNPAPVAGDYNNDGLTDLNPPNSAGPVNLAGWQETVTINDVTVGGSLGLHSVIAAYQGDQLHAQSSSAPIDLQGPKSVTSVVLNVSPLPLYPGQKVFLKATVSPSAVGNDQPTGTITFSNGPNPLGKFAVTNGQALSSKAVLPLGQGKNVTLLAFYSGDNKFTSSVSVPVVLTSSGALRTASVTSLHISPDPVVKAGTVLTLNSNVTANGAPVTKGLILFYDHAAGNSQETVVGQAQLTQSGRAWVKLRLAIGLHSIRAVFRGTNAVAGSSAIASANVTGKVSTTTDLSISPPIWSATVTANGPVTPSGDVYLYDGSNKDFVVAKAPLGEAQSTLSLTPARVPIHLDSEQIAVAVGDFNNDGFPDLAVLRPTNVFPGPYALVVLLGDAHGKFTQKFSVDGIKSTSISIADFNGDGIPDLTLNGGQGPVVVMLGVGDGTFYSKLSPIVQYSMTSLVGDFNGDGIPDLLGARTASNTFEILFGKGDGTFVPSTANTHLRYCCNPVLGDFNGDGILDIAFAPGDPSNPILLALGNGDGTFVRKNVPMKGICGNSVTPTTTDFNGDGFTDLLVFDCSSNLVALLGDGGGSFRVARPRLPSVPSSDFFSGATIADMNGDGIPDVVTEWFTFGPQVRMLLGTGDGGFVAGPDLAPPGEVLQTAAGDFNGDGVADLVTAGTFTSQVSEWFGSVARVSQTSPFEATVPGAGIHKVLANYLGTANLENSASKFVSVAATKIFTKTALSVTSNQALPSSVFNLVANVAPADYANYTPTGKVSFYSSGVFLASVAVSGSQASYSATLPVGSYQFSAIYQGDNNFNASPSLQVSCCAANK